MTDVLKMLLETGKEAPQEYGNKYVDNFNHVFQYVREHQGLKSDFFVNDIERELNKIRFCAVFSDLTSIYFEKLGKDESQLIVKDLEHIKDEFKVTIPSSLVEELRKENGKFNIHPAFLIRNPKDIQKSINLLEPLIKSERMILHNMRAVMCLSNKKIPTLTTNEAAKTVWEIFNVSPDSPEGHWFVSENSKQTGSFPISFNPVPLKDKEELFNITIPYIQNIPLKELDKIITDNNDTILNFRSGIKQLISEAKNNNKTIDELKFDLVQPVLETLDRNFRRIKSLHQIKIGASVGSITLSFIALSIADFAQGISSWLGISGLGYMLNSESEFQKEIERLKENKLYFLWKIKNENLSGRRLQRGRAR